MLTSFASLSWRLVGPGVVAVAFNLARYAYSNSDLLVGMEDLVDA